MEKIKIKKMKKWKKLLQHLIPWHIQADTRIGFEVFFVWGFRFDTFMTSKRWVRLSRWKINVFQTSFRMITKLRIETLIKTKLVWGVRKWDFMGLNYSKNLVQVWWWHQEFIMRSDYLMFFNLSVTTFEYFVW